MKSTDAPARYTRRGLTKPLLIRGVKATLGFSSIEVRLEGEPDITTAPSPILALGSPGKVNLKDLYLKTQPGRTVIVWYTYFW